MVKNVVVYSFQSQVGNLIFWELEWAVNRSGQGPFKPDIARKDHHMIRETITASEIDM
jgi:hypothetical protein